jgi:hypothetical protein
MKFNFLAYPLAVYRDSIFMEPGEVNEALTSAMVGVFFAVRHYYLRDKKFGTFQADIQQTKIAKPSGSITSSGSKMQCSRGTVGCHLFHVHSLREGRGPKKRARSERFSHSGVQIERFKVRT